MTDEMLLLKKRIDHLEASLLELVDLQSQQSHWMSLMARQVRQMASEMDMDIEPPRMN